MPFGLTNILVIYQRQNNNILKLYFRKFVIYYLNNILIYIKIKLIIKELFKINLKFKLSKYKFKIKEIIFLRYIIKLEKIIINSIKIKVI